MSASTLHLELEVYVDVDGVLADMNRYMLTTLQCYYPNPNFCLEVEKLQDADLLMDYLIPFKPEILTAEPNTWKWPNCEAQKRTWVRLNFDVDKVNVVQHAVHKQRYCKGPSSVFVDDSALNIEQWKACGGIGILHRSSLDTLQQLQSLDISLTSFIP